MLLDRLRAAPGTYALLLACTREVEIQVGRLGRLRLRPGYYVYIGSALGPGGVRARVGHHARLAPRPHWHIDYLRPHVELLEVWCRYGPARLEHRWAAALARRPGLAIAMPGFGVSDCRCPAHLLYSAGRPEWTGPRTRLSQGPTARELC